jgi:hypothetical protein
MKEEFCVDISFLQKVENLVGYGYTAWDSLYPLELCRAIIKIYIESDDNYKQLKTLDDNAKREIARLKDWVEAIESAPGSQRQYHHRSQLDLLESLYETK